jgi:hypothetical protein
MTLTQWPTGSVSVIVAGLDGPVALGSGFLYAWRKAKGCVMELSDADQVTMSEYLNSVLDAYKAAKIEREKEGGVKPSAALSRSGLKAKTRWQQRERRNPMTTRRLQLAKS